GGQFSPTGNIRWNIHHSDQVLDRVDDTLVAKVRAEASDYFSSHAFVILLGVKPLDTLLLREAIFRYRREHPPVGLFPFFFELLALLYRLFAETSCTCFDSHLRAVSVVSN